MSRLQRFLPHASRSTVLAGVGLVVVLGIGGMAIAASSSPDSGSTSTPSETSASSDAASGASQQDGGSGDDSVAVAQNSRDGGEVYSVRLKIVQTDDPVVDAGNAAVAAAECSDCTTVAIAIEGVLVYGDDVTEVTPVNLAIALNSNCTNCQTLAAAYQKVTQNDTRVRITGEGRQKIAQLRRELNTLRTRDLTLEEIAAEADRIAGEFFDVLENEVLPVGRPADASSAASSTSSTAGSADAATPTTPESEPASAGSKATTTSPTASSSPATTTSRAPSSSAATTNASD